jgi:hypothetical protein
MWYLRAGYLFVRNFQQLHPSVIEACRVVMHFQLTAIDGRHFIESVKQSVVFVNGVRCHCKLLYDGCTITLGGTRKTFTEGSSFPTSMGPHVVYEYKVTKEIGLAGIIYCEPVFPSVELLTLEDIVDGRVVLETYHMEDFNATMVISFLVSNFNCSD